MTRHTARPEREEWELSLDKTEPWSAKGFLESAERRLVSVLKHHERPSKIVAAAERVRRAQLGCLKANDRIADIPTEVDVDDLYRHRANISRARQEWEAMSVHEILAYYRDRERQRFV